MLVGQLSFLPFVQLPIDQSQNSCVKTIYIPVIAQILGAMTGSFDTTVL